MIASILLVVDTVISPSLLLIVIDIVHYESIYSPPVKRGDRRVPALRLLCSRGVGENRGVRALVCVPVPIELGIRRPQMLLFGFLFYF